MTQILQAVRVLMKNKFYSFLNIFGLAIGLSVSITILLYVQHDLSFDKHHTKHKQIYRIASDFKFNGKDDTYALSPLTLAEMMKEEFPEILAYTRFRVAGRQLFRIGNRQIYQDNLYFADSSVFNVFTHEFISGNPETALKEPRSIVLTASTAKKLFGDTEPLGQLLKTDNTSFNVTGVIKDMPDNLHLTFEGLISLSNPRPLNAQQKARRLWNVQVYSYVLLPENFDVKILDDKFPFFFDKYMAALAIQLKLDDSYLKPKFVPLADVHFNSQALYDLPTGNKAYTKSFTAIGIFILILASINYMNLATARATNRSQEVGIRKVLGSSKVKLRSQFLIESVVITFLSLLLAILITDVILNGTSLNDLIGKDLKLDFVNNKLLLFGSVGVTLVIGLLSGIYPAFYLSAISVLIAMKGSMNTGPKSLLLRKGLVAFQFLISIGVVISTLLMGDQVSYMRAMDLGFSKDNVVIIQTNDTTNRNRMELTKSELLQNPNIISVTAAFGISNKKIIGNNLLGAGRRVLDIEQEDASMTKDSYNILNVGKGFIEAMQMDIVAGRDFNEDMPTDLHSGVIVNQAAVDRMFWSNPIGKVVSIAGDATPNKIIGVVKNFNTHSLHEKIEPVAIYRYQIPKTSRGGLPAFVIHTKNGELKASLDYLEEKFSILDPSHPFEYQLLDQKVESLYRTDQNQSKLLGILSLVCIIISCLGLLGLTSYTTAIRNKEIGVRKVLGASIPQLVYLIFKDIMWLVVIGFLIATPLAYLFVEDWLNSFAYRMSLQSVIAVSATIVGVVALFIAFLTVSFHSLKAANQNPIKALRHE
jgi:putative ABC transport system permease protein